MRPFRRLLLTDRDNAELELGGPRRPTLKGAAVACPEFR